MDKEKYISAIEENIDFLQKQIRNLDAITGSYKYIETPKIKGNKGQLSFEAKGFSSDEIRDRLKDYLLAEDREAQGRKIVPMPGLEASFCYDFVKNEWWAKGPTHLIWGFEDQRNSNFEEVIQMVVKKDENEFEDRIFGSIGKGSHVITKPILLENGNQIIEEYNFLYHGGDYEHRSPLLLQGKTKLVGINK